MCLRFVFLLTTRMTSWLRLSRREEAWKTAEILILRHQLAVPQRRQPRRRTWTGRTGDLPAQDSDLMPQDHDLRVLNGITASQQRQPAEHPAGWAWTR